MPPHCLEQASTAPPPLRWFRSPGPLRSSPCASPPPLFVTRPAPTPPPAGPEGCRRLAARLVPRYARHFPQHADTAADTLIALAKLSLSGARLLAVGGFRQRKESEASDAPALSSDDS